MKTLRFAIAPIIALLFPWAAFASDLGGADEINVDYGYGGGLRSAVVNFVQTVLTYVTIIAVITIIIAGFYLIFSLGNDSNKETAKKIVIYTIVGVILIVLSKAIIYFVMNAI